MKWTGLIVLMVVGCGPRVSSPLGGVRMTLRADLSKIAAADHAKAMSKTLRSVESRLADLSKEEFLVRSVGRDEIRLEIGGKVTLAEVRGALLGSGEVRFCWARNLTTARQANRPYTVVVPPTAGNPYRFATSDAMTPVADSKVIKDWVTILEKEDIESVTATNFNSKWVPAFRFTKAGGAKVKAWCLAMANKQENLALVIDGSVYSVAPLQPGAIIERDGVIQDAGAPTQVRKLVAKVNAAMMPVRLSEVDSQEFRP